MGGHNCVRLIIMSDFYMSLFLKCYNQNFDYFFHIIPVAIDFIHEHFKIEQNTKLSIFTFNKKLKDTVMNWTQL